ncbi:hypothetical protein HF289_08920 [Acidithiobacillus ferrooxidans]|uniref:hypothetical protein n=1 Tax=Acidithiobacillus ferrooxidans TaxID=920 RepID=UPI001C06F7A3|nr:hypothetical protein [Acidithiobacillus ferrooxidans]MBU2856991.1 hypothetical protein [Acidithiobacillus ferrooxidans]
MMPFLSSNPEIASLSIALMWAVFIGAFAALLVYDALGFIMSQLIRLVDRFSARRPPHD